MENYKKPLEKKIVVEKPKEKTAMYILKAKTDIDLPDWLSKILRYKIMTAGTLVRLPLSESQLIECQKIAGMEVKKV